MHKHDKLQSKKGNSNYIAATSWQLWQQYDNHHDNIEQLWKYTCDCYNQ